MPKRGLQGRVDEYKKQLETVRRKEIKTYLGALAGKFSSSSIEAVQGVVSGVFNEAIG